MVLPTLQPEKKLSIRAIASELGISDTALTLYISGKRSLKPDIEKRFITRYLPRLKEHKKAKNVSNFVSKNFGNITAIVESEAKFPDSSTVERAAVNR